MERDSNMKKQKTSVAGKIIKVINKKPKTVEEIKQELKDRFGYNEKAKDVGINLLYLLRREKINRKKEDKVYKYFI